MTFDKLGNIISITKGKKNTFTNTFNKNSIRYIQIDDLRNDDNIKYSNDSKGVLADIEDLLIAWDGANAGTIGYGKKGYVGSTIARLKLIYPIKYHTPFLGLFLKTKSQYLRGQSTGATIPHINKQVLEEIKIPVFNLKDQISIAFILNNTLQLISQRKRSIQLLNEYLKSSFLDLFGNPIKNDKKWEIKTLQDICTKITDGTHHSPPIQKEGIPYITAKHVRENAIDFWGNPWFISEKDHQEIYKRCDPIKGDVLYIKDGATTGYAAINRYEFEFSMLSSLALLRVDNTVCCPQYLCFWLNNESVKNTILNQMAGGAIKRLTIAKIKKLFIHLPPLSLQNQFAQIVEKAENLKAYYQKSLEELENLYGSLSQRAFKGELDLSKLDVSQELEAHIKQYGEIETEKTEEKSKIEKERVPEEDVQEFMIPYGPSEGSQPEILVKYTSESIELSSETLNSEHIAKLIKEKYKGGYHFTFEMLMNYLVEQQNQPIPYHSSEELLRKPELYSEQDIRSFVFSAIVNIEGERQKPNPFLKLNQVFYNAEEENFDLRVTDEDYEQLRKLPKEERSGIYFSIVEP